MRRSFDTFAVIYPLPTLATVEVCQLSRLKYVKLINHSKKDGDMSILP